MSTVGTNPFFIAVRYFLSALMVLSSLFVYSQDWPSSDSRWQYNFNVAGGLNGTYEMRVEGDTVLNDHVAKVIERRAITNWPQEGGEYVTVVGDFSTAAFVRSAGDSVFFWSDSQFYLLYDFSSEIGNGWLVDVSTSGFPGCQDSAFVSVIGTGITEINGLSRRYIDLVTDSESEYGLSGRAIEGVGLVNETYNYGFTLFPGIHPCGSVVVDGSDTGFKCYSDNVIGSYSPDGENCWFVGIEEFKSPIVNIFPIPTKDELRIEFDQGNPGHTVVPNIMVIDIDGKTIDVEFEKASTEGLVIYVSHLPSGLYTVVIFGKEGTSSRRFIKN